MKKKNEKNEKNEKTESEKTNFGVVLSEVMSKTKIKNKFFVWMMCKKNFNRNLSVDENIDKILSTITKVPL